MATFSSFEIHSAMKAAVAKPGRAGCGAVVTSHHTEVVGSTGHGRNPRSGTSAAITE